MRNLLLICFVLASGLAHGQPGPFNSSFGLGDSAVSANVRLYGATASGLGGTDDTVAFTAAINAAMSRYQAGRPAIVYIPSGAYYINGSTLPVAYHVPIQFVGDGAFATFIYLGPNYTGDLFSWSEDWAASAYNGSASPAQPSSWQGPGIRGVTILGSQAFTNVVNALNFYDRNDAAFVSDVQLFNIHGSCLKIGASQLNAPQAYMRESVFYNVKCFTSGTSSIPAVEIASNSASGGIRVLQAFCLRGLWAGRASQELG